MEITDSSNDSIVNLLRNNNSYSSNDDLVNRLKTESTNSTEPTQPVESSSMMDNTIQSMQDTIPFGKGIGEAVGVVGSQLVAPVAGGIAGIAGGVQDFFDPNVRGAGGKAEQYQQAVERELTPTNRPKSGIANVVMDILNKAGQVAIKGTREIAAAPSDVLSATNLIESKLFNNPEQALLSEQQDIVAQNIRDQGIAKTVLQPFMESAEASDSDIGAAATAIAEGAFTAVPSMVGMKAKGNVLRPASSAAKNNLMEAWGIPESEIPAVTKALEDYSANTKGYQGTTPEALAQKALLEGKDSQLAKSLQSYVKEKVTAEPNFARQVAEVESANRDVLGQALTDKSKPLPKIARMEAEAKAIQNQMYEIPEGLPKIDISEEVFALEKLANDPALSASKKALVNKAVNELYDQKTTSKGLVVKNVKTDPRSIKTIIDSITEDVLADKDYGPALSKTGIKDIRTSLEDKIGSVYKPFAEAREINYQLESAITREKAVNEIIDKSFPKYAKTGDSILTSEFKPDKVFDLVNAKVPDSQKLKKLLGDKSKYFDSLYGGKRPLFTKSEYEAFVNAAKDSAIKKATESKIKTSNTGSSAVSEGVMSRAVGTGAASIPGAGLADVYRARIIFDFLKPGLKRIPGYKSRVIEIDKLVNDALISPEQAIKLLNAPNRGYIKAINEIMSKPAKAAAIGAATQINKEENK